MNSSRSSSCQHPAPRRRRTLLLLLHGRRRGDDDVECAMRTRFSRTSYCSIDNCCFSTSFLGDHTVLRCSSLPPQRRPRKERRRRKKSLARSRRKASKGAKSEGRRAKQQQSPRKMLLSECTWTCPGTTCTRGPSATSSRALPCGCRFAGRQTATNEMKSFVLWRNLVADTPELQGYPLPFLVERLRDMMRRDDNDDDEPEQ